MKLYLREVFKRAFIRKRLAVLAVATAVVGAVGLMARRVHFVSELLTTEVFIALLFLAVLVIIST